MQAKRTLLVLICLMIFALIRAAPIPETGFQLDYLDHAVSHRNGNQPRKPIAMMSGLLPESAIAAKSEPEMNLANHLNRKRMVEVEMKSHATAHSASRLPQARIPITQEGLKAALDAKKHVILAEDAKVKLEAGRIKGKEIEGTKPKNKPQKGRLATEKSLNIWGRAVDHLSAVWNTRKANVAIKKVQKEVGVPVVVK